MFEIWHKLHSPYCTHSHYSHIIHTHSMHRVTCVHHENRHTVARALQAEHPSCSVVICLKVDILCSFSGSYFYLRCLLGGLHTLMFKKCIIFLILSIAVALHWPSVWNASFFFSPVLLKAPRPKSSVCWLVSSRPTKECQAVKQIWHSGQTM